VLIEDQASGIALIQELQSKGFYSVFAFKPKGSKVERLYGATPMFESGHVLLPDAAGWLEAYLHELCAFPRGKHDDQVDSTTQALEWIRTEGLEPGLIGFYRQEVERQRAFTENRTVQMKGPASVSTVILMDGTIMSIPPDGMILVTPENARPLRRAGWAEIPLH
jgi:hypothetical protein